MTKLKTLSVAAGLFLLAAAGVAGPAWSWPNCATDANGEYCPSFTSVSRCYVCCSSKTGCTSPGDINACEQCCKPANGC